MQLHNQFLVDFLLRFAFALCNMFILSTFVLNKKFEKYKIGSNRRIELNVVDQKFEEINILDSIKFCIRIILIASRIPYSLFYIYLHTNHMLDVTISVHTTSFKK